MNQTKKLVVSLRLERDPYFPLARGAVHADIRNLMNKPSVNSDFLFVEALEDRIAPAAVIFSQGGNLLSSGDDGYLSLGNEPGSSALLVKVLGGKALVFWDAQDKVIKGISVTDGAKLEIHGDVAGDIVTNLLSSGYLTDSDNNTANGLDGGKLLASSIAGVKVTSFIDQSGHIQSGSIGRIVAGGSISNVSVSGSLGGVFSGDGIFDAVATAVSPNLAHGNSSTLYSFNIGFDFDSSGPLNATSMSLTKGRASFAANASISAVNFTSGQNVQIFSGDGFDGVAGAYATGGSISGIHFVATTVDSAITTNFFAGKSLTISAGDGGSGTATGGVGGAVSNIADGGTSGDVVIHSGCGGDGASTGGAGGKITLLDLRGTPHHYLVQAGDGGAGGTTGGAGGNVVNNNISAIASSQFLTLAGDFHTVFTDVAKTDAERGFFVINRSSGEMTLIAGDTLTTVPPLILSQAANPVDAIVTDLNADNYLDVVVAYSDGNFGVLINDKADGFHYSVGSLGGIVPTKVVAGDFLGIGGRPELAFISSTGSTTTIKMFEITNPLALDGANPAAAFSSDPTVIKPFVYSKGGMVDAVGGSFPLSTLGALDLNADKHNDLLLAFDDGRIQGVYATGSATVGDPFAFSVGTAAHPAPFATLSGGIRDIDFNFAKDATQQRLAIVNAAGTKAYVATIGAATLVDPSKITIPPTALPLPTTGTVGTLFQAKWTDSILDTKDVKSTSLVVLASQGTSSSLLSYDTSLALKNVYKQDFLINSIADNFLFASNTTSGEADSFIFATPSAILAKAIQKTLPSGSSLVFGDIPLPFAAKTVTVLGGDGGSAGKGTGGLGGSITGLNLDSGAADVIAGDGGGSTSGTGGNGGSIDNSASFKTVANVSIVPGLNSSAALTVMAGNGATVAGTTSAAKGGAGGSVKSLLVLNSTVLDVSGGNGGGSKGGAAGAGGLLGTVTVYNGGGISLHAGDGGNGDTSTFATGGAGGSVSKITLGTMSATSGNTVSGDVIITAGAGGLSALASGGSGGSVSTVTAGNFKKTGGAFLVTAGNGGSTSAVAATTVGGLGGSISGVTVNSIAGSISLVAGAGGSAVAGVAGNGGGVSSVVSTASGILSAGAGDGGQATGAGSKGKGGNGGTINLITAGMIASGYSDIHGGAGGSSVGGIGGSGGAVSNVSLQLNPANNGGGDETLGVTVRTGNGGSGSSGGVGGLLSLFQAKGIYDETNGIQTAINSIALRLIAGNGGNGTVFTGAAGGSIQLTKTLEGISQIDTQSTNLNFQPGDEGLRVFAGNGGNGITAGGNGGLVSGVKVANTLNSVGTVIPVNLLGGAYVASGDGGDTVKGTAGSGGAVSGLGLGVEGAAGTPTGNVRVHAGDGGDSATGTGGAGGAVSSSKFVAVKGNDTAGYAVLVTGGDGGTGMVRGGNGGGLSGLTTTLPQVGVANTAPNIYSGLFIAGSGGAGTASVKSAGGTGGSISGISQTQNVYSVINLIQAGSGGNSSADTVGGLGGSVSSITTVGSIGAQVARASVGGPQIPQGIYNTVATSTLIDPLFITADVQQGVFSGLGGSGLKDGNNGTVSGIKAQTIAAIAAANRSGSFEKAATVSSVTTFLLGYDINGNGIYEAGDGFVMAGGNKISGLYSLNTQLITAAALQAQTAPFIIP